MQLSVSPANQVVLQKLSTNWWPSSLLFFFLNFYLTLANKKPGFFSLVMMYGTPLLDLMMKKELLKNTAISNYKIF